LEHKQLASAEAHPRAGAKAIMLLTHVWAQDGRDEMGGVSARTVTEKSPTRVGRMNFILMSLLLENGEMMFCEDIFFLGEIE